MKATRICGVLSVAALALTAAMPAADATPLAGTFDISGDFTVTNTGITWANNVSPSTANEAGISPGPTGSFAALGSTTATIDNLALGTVGSIPAQTFLSFDAAPLLATLEVNKIFAGVEGSADCTMPPAPGQQCTPSSTSPFNFMNNPPAPGQATMTFALSGVTSDGLSTWFADFTSQFTVPYQTLLNDLGAPNGSFTNTYSANFVVTADTVPTGVPEPFTISLFGAGLVGAAALRRRKVK